MPIRTGWSGDPALSIRPRVTRPVLHLRRRRLRLRLTPVPHEVATTGGYGAVPRWPVPVGRTPRRRRHVRGVACLRRGSRAAGGGEGAGREVRRGRRLPGDRKSTRLNSSHV